MTQAKLYRLATSSKEFRCERGDVSVLIVSDYYDRSNYIKIDFKKLTPEILKEISPDEESEDYYA